MHVEYFAFFRDFAKTMSISQTAANFYMTPQGISRAIHTLEKEFGTPLISRSKQTVSLTEAGKTLLDTAECLTEAYDEAHRCMAAFSAAGKTFEGETVCMVVTAFVSTYLLPLMDLYSSQLFPFNLSIQESNIYRILPKVKTNTKPHSFALISLPEVDHFETLLGNALEQDDLTFLPLMRVPLQVLVSVSSSLAGYKRLRTDDLKDHPVIIYKDPVLFDALTEIMEKQNVVMSTSSFLMLQQELEKNHAVTFAPAIAAGKGLPKATVLKTLEDGYYTRVGFFASKEALEDTLNQEVLCYIQNFFIDHQNQCAFKNTYEILRSEPLG